MPPTICSGKKRQTREANIRSNNRRYLQTADLAGNVNQNSNVHATQASHFNELRHLQKIVRNEVNSNYRQLVVDMSDNAVTSTTHLGGSQSEAESSDAECRLRGRDNVSNDSSYYTNANSNPNRDSSSSMFEEKNTPHHPARCISDADACDNDDDDGDDDDNDDVADVFDGYESSRDVSQKSAEMDCETVSMTSLDTEKSAKLKRGNQPMLRDKLMAKHHNGVKCMANIRNTEGLLSIAIKTIKLVKRNQLLQQRLTQLQMETSDFIQSVLANPENSHFRTKIQQNV